MILYHGSNVEVREPRLLRIQRDLDFGKGFYTTSDYEQAVSWARRTARIRGSGKPSVSCYDIDTTVFDDLRILHFENADVEWLEYVAANRKGVAPRADYDLVIGPVANDQTFPTLLLYLDGYLDAASAIKQLMPQKLKDQIVFKSALALSALSFLEVRLP